MVVNVGRRFSEIIQLKTGDKVNSRFPVDA